jgi:hypothetical protein
MAEETKTAALSATCGVVFLGAFGAALAIHLTAVALAQKHEVAVEVPPDIPTAVIEATLQASEEPTPPPEDIPLPEPPPPPEIQPEFVEETTPPPKKPQAQKFTPIKAPQAAGRPVPCQFPQRKRWPLMRRARSTRMRRVHDMSLAAECVSSKSVQAAA